MRVVTPRVLVLGVGDGRNVGALIQRGAWVEALDDDASRVAHINQRFKGESGLHVVSARYDSAFPFAGAFDGALSTHALLHGTAQSVRAALAAVYAALRPGAPFHLVLGSRADPRFGRGRRLDENTFAPLDGREAGVAHVYFDERGVRDVLAAFELSSLEERSAALTAGRWAHSADEAETLVHWFVRAERPPQ